MYVSILGDSISTYTGYNPLGYAVFYEGENARNNNLQSVYDTWWAKVNQFLQAYLCVNASYSGSKVSGNNFPAANSMERIRSLHTPNISPDVILVYIGFNDFGYGVPIKRSTFLRKDPSCFQDAYRLMLQRLKKQYPTAKIICGTLMKSYIKEKAEWRFPDLLNNIPFEAYNETIRDSCKHETCMLADLASLNLLYETLDGTHPTKNGHQIIANAWISLLKPR